jgi:hypothetical protein
MVDKNTLIQGYFFNDVLISPFISFIGFHKPPICLYYLLLAFIYLY